MDDAVTELVDRRWEEYGIGLDPSTDGAARRSALQRLLQR
jgi:hypothetical protein